MPPNDDERGTIADDVLKYNALMDEAERIRQRIADRIRSEVPGFAKQGGGFDAAE